MFTCALHNWFSDSHPCPACPTITTASTDLIINPEALIDSSLDQLIVSLKGLQTLYADNIEKYKEFSNNAYSSMNVKAADMWNHKRDGLIVAERDMRALISKYDSGANSNQHPLQGLMGEDISKEAEGYTTTDGSSSQHGGDAVAVLESLKQIVEVLGAVNFSSHKQMREGIEGAMALAETGLYDAAQSTPTPPGESLEKVAQKYGIDLTSYTGDQCGLSQEEWNLEQIVDKIRELTTLEAIGLVRRLTVLYNNDNPATSPEIIDQLRASNPYKEHRRSILFKVWNECCDTLASLLSEKGEDRVKELKKAIWQISLGPSGSDTSEWIPYVIQKCKGLLSGGEKGEEKKEAEK